MTEEEEEYNPLELSVGEGTLKITDDGLTYRGTYPIYEEGETEAEVCMIRKRDWELVMETGLAMLAANRFEMPPEMFELFPDPMGFSYSVDPDMPMQTTNLFLQRRLYFQDPRKEIWIRYESVAQAFEEEDIPDADS